MGAHPILHRAICDSSKPGRDQTDTVLWVVHSTMGYADAHMNGEQIRQADTVETSMREAFLAAAGYAQGAAPCIVLYSSVFGWDHAQPQSSTSLAEPYRLDPDRKAGMCGDFFGGDEQLSGVEAAA